MRAAAHADAASPSSPNDRSTPSSTSDSSGSGQGSSRTALRRPPSASAYRCSVRKGHAGCSMTTAARRASRITAWMARRRSLPSGPSSHSSARTAGTYDWLTAPTTNSSIARTASCSRQASLRAVTSRTSPCSLESSHRSACPSSDRSAAHPTVCSAASNPSYEEFCAWCRCRWYSVLATWYGLAETSFLSKLSGSIGLAFHSR